MTYTTKMTQKGQITIPKHIRDLMGVGRDSELVIAFDESFKGAWLKPLTTLEDLAGSMSSDISATDKEISDARAASWVSGWK